MFTDFAQRNYLQERSVPEIIKSAFEIYRDYFRELFLAYFLLVFPAWLLSFVLMFAAAVVLVSSGWVLVSVIVLYYLFNYLVSIIASIAVMNIVSDIYLGNSVGILKAYKSMSFKSINKLVATTLLVYLILGMVYVVLVLPCVIGNCEQYAGLLIALVLIFLLSELFVWTILQPYTPVVVFEKRWGFNALRRSANISRRYRFRILVIMFLILSIIIGNYALTLTFTIFFGFLAQLLGTIVSVFLYPLTFIYIAVMYYDFKVRNEGYDAVALEADLRH